MKNEEKVMQIILHGGNARSLAFEALALAKEGKFAEASARLGDADREMEEAHALQTGLLQSEARGTGQAATLLLAHALDHVMNASTERGLIEEIIELYKRGK